MDSDLGMSGLLQQTVPVQVKNTFLTEEGINDDSDAFRRRQVSAPAACANALPQSSAVPLCTSLLDELNATWNQADDNNTGKNRKMKNDGNGSGNGYGTIEPMRVQSGVGAPPMAMPPPPAWENTTTVMMRNLPNKYTQRMLLTEVNQTGFLGTFDFLYLPIDPETNANRGYAFMNFIDSGFAWMFKMSYEGRKMNRFNSSKVVSVMPATLQGFDANYAHYTSARVNRGDPSARPLFLREPSQPSQPPKAQSQKGGLKKGGTQRKNQGDEFGNFAMAQSQSSDFFAQQAFLMQPPAPAMTAMPQTRSPWTGDNSLPSLEGLQQGQGDLDFGGASSDTGGQQKLVPKFCPHCGGPIQPHFQFCPHCGNTISFANLG